MQNVSKCLYSDENDMDYEVEGARPIGRPKKTWVTLWKKTVRIDNYTRKLLWTTGNGVKGVV